MAASRSQPDDLCTCPVCCDIFTDPVVLLCGHSFCDGCLQEWWRRSGERACPVCKDLFTMSRPPRNFALRDLSDKLRRDRGRGVGGEELCGVHGEKLKLFCQDDQQPVCIICRDAQKHKKHNCVPIDEAAEEHRAELNVKLMRLKTKLGTFEEKKREFDKMERHK